MDEDDIIIEVTADNACQLLLTYFSRAPYNTIATGRKDKDGKDVFTKVACDVPTVDGFCAEYDVPPSRLTDWLDNDTIELCLAKFKNIMMINGTNRGYDAGFSGLVMKNVAGWADKTEVRNTGVITLSEGDRRMLERAGIALPALVEAQSARV